MASSPILPTSACASRRRRRFSTGGRRLSAIAVPDVGPDRGGPAAIRLDFGDLAADEVTKLRVVSITPRAFGCAARTVKQRVSSGRARRRTLFTGYFRRRRDERGRSCMRQLFGTDGMRGVAGQPPLDPDTLFRLGGGLVSYLARRSASVAPRICLGQDPRESSP